jgi:hypothetical protein
LIDNRKKKERKNLEINMDKPTTNMEPNENKKLNPTLKME